MILTKSIIIPSVSGYLGLIMSTALIAGADYLMIQNNIEVDHFYHSEIQLSVGLVSGVID